ncbi:hypothetical protein [Synechococcus elongatus]|uniref:Uncharacterized protein n=3 Tax=Synechococcus elongatus TaxID=32046 RepID=A0AAQ3RCX6_SYNEL|nr:hypothetical protein [Synechococcus elongatus]
MSASRARQLQEGDFATVQRITEGRTFPQQDPHCFAVVLGIEFGNPY